MHCAELPIDLLELARQHGIAINSLSRELTDSDLEAIVGGKQRIGNRLGDAMARVMVPVLFEATGLGVLTRALGGTTRY